MKNRSQIPLPSQWEWISGALRVCCINHKPFLWSETFMSFIMTSARTIFSYFVFPFIVRRASFNMLLGVSIPLPPNIHIFQFKNNRRLSVAVEHIKIFKTITALSTPVLPSFAQRCCVHARNYICMRNGWCKETQWRSEYVCVRETRKKVGKSASFALDAIQQKVIAVGQPNYSYVSFSEN